MVEKKTVKKIAKSGTELLKGESTLTDSKGNVKLTWTKTFVKEKNAYDAFKDAVKRLLKNPEIAGKKEIKVPTNTSSDSLSVYTIGDAHVGMLSWKKETGDDNDLEICERDLITGMSMLVAKSDETDEALIVDVGDWFHADNSSNTTNKSGNALDVDGRYPKVLEIGLRLSIKLIELALTKHKKVTWRSAIGNHNEHSAIMMSLFIKAWFRNEPRVHVADSPSMFYYHTFGKNIIGITHGHTVKAEKLGEIMSIDCEKIWSNSVYRYWYTGHIHHLTIKEFPSCVVETFRTLAGKDAWHFASGYRSRQDMKVITLHKEYGETNRATIDIRVIRDEQKRVQN